MAVGQVTTADIARVRDIDFVDQFQQGVSALMGVLGIYDVQPLTAGYKIQTYTITGTLADGTVAEGADIPLTAYKTVKGDEYTVDLKQYRKQTTKQAILKGGYANAVGKTDTKMLRDIQGVIRKDMFKFLTENAGTTVTGTDFKGVIAKAFGTLSNELSKLDTDGTPVFFANPLDLADYLAEANINNVETAFGFQYLRSFLGLGTCIFDANVPQGEIYVTAQENINAYTVDLASLGQAGFDYEMDETGLIGVHHSPEYSNGTCETYADTGLTIFPEVKNFIIKGTITKPAAKASR